ncbi:60S ribosomal protein L18 [Pteropus alecto]|uniref:60S ribosomal protein L18 n=1 Tax=Pteropus alecto TaxID=9402 RepID=L5KNI5_PTEAL|nr:60S ribosomal protein L18 [Pteropus alecto]
MQLLLLWISVAWANEQSQPPGPEPPQTLHLMPSTTRHGIIAPAPPHRWTVTAIAEEQALPQPPKLFSGSGGRKGAIMGLDIRHNKDRKGLAQGAQEPGLLPKAAGQGVQASSQTNNSIFNQVVLKRLFVSRTDRSPLSLSRMIQKMKIPGGEGKTAVVLGTITDDVRVQEVPTLKVCALRVSSRSQNLILKAGDKILTFDQMALDSPKGCGTVLLSGPRKGRKVYRYLGKGHETPHSHTKP